MITSAEEFVRLRTSKVMEEYRRAATDEVPEAVCLDVIARYPEMRSWIAHNKTVPLSILCILAQDCDVDVRVTVAMKRKANHEILHRLARDANESVRERVAYNPSTPHWVLEILVSDPVDRISAMARSRLS